MLALIAPCCDPKIRVQIEQLVYHTPVTYSSISCLVLIGHVLVLLLTGRTCNVFFFLNLSFNIGYNHKLVKHRNVDAYVP